MTGRERVAGAMSHRATDRVPVFCQLALGHYMLRGGRDPYRVWYSPDDFTDLLVEFAKKYRFDGILVNIPGRPQNWESMIASVERRPGETKLTWEGGGHSLCPDGDNAHYFGAGRLPSLDEVDPSSLFYIEPHSIAQVSYPYSFDFAPPASPTVASFFPDYYLDTLTLAIRKSGGELHVSSEVFSPFTQMMELLGYNDGLIALMEDPDKCCRILEALAGGAAELALRQARAGADAVLVSSAFAGGGFLSLEQYRRFVQPYESHIVGRVHAETRAPVYVHTCGAIGDRIGLMVEAGYDGIDTMDPPPLGNTDIRRVKEEFGDRIFLKGNLDPVNLLLGGSAEAVRAKAEELISTAGAGGGYILSTACSVSPATDPSRIALLAQASANCIADC